MGITSDPLNILGIVRLPICLGKGISIIRLDFYGAFNFTLPSDGLLGLTSMTANQMVIYPEYSTEKIPRKNFWAMNRPIPLALQWERQPENVIGTFQTSPVLIGSIFSLVSKTSPNSAERFQHETALNQPCIIDPSGKWKVIIATVIGDHDIPHCMAMHFPVSVPKASV